MIPGEFRLPKRSRKNIVILGAISFAGIVGFILTVILITFIISAWLGRPLSVFGLDDGPDQPIAFPHTTHVQEIGLDCTFCHRNVTEGESATVPAVGLCMTCHKTVGDGIAGVEKLRQFHEDERPINWVRVHRLPDHVQFIHEPHMRFFSGSKTVVERLSDRESQIMLSIAKHIDPNAKLGQVIDIGPSSVCSICHGDVGSMIKVKQVRSLKMGDCVDCHRDNSAPTDCVTCHY